jgi:hypothetical protein
MMEHFELLDGVAVWFGTLVVFTAFWSIGRLIPNRPVWETPLIGWSLVYLLSITTALSGLHSLKLVLAIAGFCAVAIPLWRRPILSSNRYYFPYLAALPLLALSVVTIPIFADSYSHWLPNAVYLYQLDHFPKAPLAGFISLHPTYPNALPLVIYMSSVITGRFMELSGHIVNVVMFLLAMGCVWQLLRDNWPRESDSNVNSAVSRYLIAATAFCIAVPLNPAIEIQYYWSVIADPALAILVLLLAAQYCRYMTHEEAGGAKSTLFAFFMLGCLASGLKPNVWPLAGILVMSAGAVASINRIPLRRWLPPGVAIVCGTFFSAFLWNLYLGRHLPLPDQFSLRPLDRWSFELWDELLLAMLQILRTHTLYSALVLMTMGFGFASMIRRTLIANPMLRLMIGLVSIAMSLHVASLLAAYLGTGFEDWMITTASSFPRYTAQVGYAVCATGLLAAASILVPMLASRLASLSSRAVAAACLASCAALFAVMTVRPTLALKPVAHERAQQRKLALAALKVIEPGDRVAAAAPKWTINYLRYVIWADLAPHERPSLVDDVMIFNSSDVCETKRLVTNWISNPSVDAVLLVDAHAYTSRCAVDTSPTRVWRRPAGRWQKLDLLEDRAG